MSGNVNCDSKTASNSHWLKAIDGDRGSEAVTEYKLSQDQGRFIFKDFIFFQQKDSFWLLQGQSSEARFHTAI